MFMTLLILKIMNSLLQLNYQSNTTGKIGNTGGDIVDGLFILNQDNIASFNIDTRDWVLITSEIALTNKTNLQQLIDDINIDSNIDGLWIEDLDIYFEVRHQREDESYNATPDEIDEKAIHLYSDFTLKMANNVHLRAYPNNTPSYAVLSVYDVDNVTITGGNIWGDRYEHDYQEVDGSTLHEWGNAISLIGSHYVTFNGVNARNGTGDGYYISKKAIRNPSDGSLTGGNRTTENSVIKNCIVDGNRRNNLSPVDCNGLTIENNTISNAGVNGGILPRSGIDLECWRARDEEGNLLEYGRVENVIIRNNTFIDSSNSDLIVYTAQDVEIYGNSFQKGIRNQASFRIEIHHNTFTSPILHDADAIYIKPNVLEITEEQLVYDWSIHDNTIDGYLSGINVAGDDFTVYNNTVTNSKRGIVFGTLDTATFYDNVITNSEHGYSSYTGSGTAIDVTVTNGTAAGLDRGLWLVNMVGTGTGITFTNCDFSGSTYDDIKVMSTSSNITIDNCTYDTLDDDGSNTNITINP